MPRAAAFFDLDKTLIEGSSALHFARASYKAGMRSRREIAKDVWANLRFRLRGATDEETEILRDSVLDALAGVRVLDIQRLGPEVLGGILPAVYPEMLAEAWSHQDAGRPAYIVTAAGVEIAESLARVLAFDGGIGMRSEVRDGVYTGRPDGPFTYGQGKVVAIEELARAEGFDLDECYAYSDSVSDLPMLRAVGNPVAVNPDKELARVAREEAWRVMRFDKLGRRLRVAGTVGALALVGGTSGFMAGRLGERRRPRLPSWPSR
jgi:HAD superfamily hydrolase (TIGR01490 family)